MTTAKSQPKRTVCLGAALLLFGAGGQAVAAQRLQVTAPSGNGQAALTVGVDPSGQLRAATCPAAPCVLAGGMALNIPEEAAQKLAAEHVVVVPIGQRRQAVVIAVPSPRRQLTWQAVVVAPLGGGPARVLFEGWTGLVEGEYGLRRGPMVQVTKTGRAGEHLLVIGEQQEDVSLCGRPTILAPQVLLPDDLELHPAKVQRLSIRERDGAARLSAVRIEEAAQVPPAAAPAGAQEAPIALPRGVPLLRATAASSAVGLPSALTDGDPATTWAENRGGAGKGEFVVMNAPERIPLTAFEVMVRPPGTPPERAVAPREFWIVADEQVFLVTMPENAWEHPGARYRVALPGPTSATCVALVTESAYDEHPSSRVTFAEFAAVPELDTTNLGLLVGLLNGGGPRAEAAAAALSAMGAPAFEMVMKAYDKLDAEGHRLALNVMDHAPCSVKVPLYVRALFGAEGGERIHARDRIRRCGAEASDALVEALRSAPPRRLPLLAAELSMMAPGRAIQEIAPRLTGSKAQRQLLRKALASAVRQDPSEDIVRRVLGDAALPKKAAIDLLRALGRRAAAYQPDASKLLVRLLSSAPDFRTRYLLVEPASTLAATSPEARAFVSRSLSSDPSPYVRTRAAQVIARPERYGRELVQATSDPDARVREAAVQALANPTARFAEGAILERLDDDSWPFVRVAAAAALGKLGPSPRVDGSLGEALDDDSEDVRRAVIEALGARRVRAQAAALRDLLDDGEEPGTVRIAAAHALGAMCDFESVAILARLLRPLTDPMASQEKRSLAWAALEAIGQVHPRDLREHLGPLLGKEGVSDSVRRAAQAALASPAMCGRR